MITAESPLPAGTRLGPYRIVALLGRGGMADVYRADDTRLNRVVALKVLGADVADTPQRRQRFEREARAISALSHPRICVLYDVGEDRGRPFLVMEYVAGETLAQRLRRGALPIPEALRLAILIADALDHAHRQGVVHRDLKPANVMLTSAGPKLVDFGLAKLREADPEPTSVTVDTESLTADGVILGTLPYMAPEQVEGTQADSRSDIFAFGALLYEMITARRAFDAPSKAGLIVSILERDPPPICDAPQVKALGDAGPTAALLEHVVSRCLAKQPDDRWQTAADLMRELRWIAEPRASPPKAPTSRRMVALAAGVTVALVGAALAYALWHSAPGAAPPLASVVTFPLALEPGTVLVSGPASPQMAVSPDGQWIAYAAGSSSVTAKLWLWHVSDASRRPLEHTDGAAYPFWSPDSQSIGFFAAGRLKTTRLDDKAPVDLAPAVLGDSGAWGADDTILFAQGQNTVLMRVSTRTPHEVTAATKFDEARHERRHGWPSFLPDGRRFIYYVQSADPDLTGIALATVGVVADRSRVILKADARAAYAHGSILFGRQTTLFTQPFDAERETFTGDASVLETNVASNAENGRMAYSASDSILVYRAGDKGGISPARLEWRDPRGQVVEPFSDVALYGAVALSPDGRRAVVGRANPSELRLFDHGPDSSQLAHGAQASGTPVWSADGNAVVYELGSTVFRKDLRTNQESRLFSDSRSLGLTGWSPDGRTLLFGVKDPVTGLDIWEAPADGGPARPYLATPYSEGHAQFSPNGRWIVYVSDESGAREVWVGTYPASSTRLKISDGGGFMPQWRADGRALYYLDAASRLIEVGVQLRPTFQAGVSRPLFKGDVNQGLAQHFVSQYAVSPDGQRFLFKTVISDPPMMVLLNWPSAIRR